MQSQRRDSFMQMYAKFGGAVIAVALLWGAAIACRSSSTGKSCTGEVTYEGETYTGVGGNLEEAQRFACNNYCLAADPEFDAHYGIWLNSRSGEAAGRPPKKEAIYK